MKRIFFVSFLAFATLFSFRVAANPTIDINGTQYTVDTLEHYQAGPGVMYTKFTIKNGQKLRTLYVLETDMTNPYNKIEEWQSQGQVGTFQLLTDAHKAMDAPAHHPIGSVNCNFWIGTPNIEVDPTLAGCDGQCLSGTARNGYLVGEPMANWNRGYAGDDWNQSVGFVMITKEKRAFIDDMWYDGYVHINGKTHALRDCNRTRTSNYKDEIAMYNEYIGNRNTRATTGVEIVFTPDEWSINETMLCTVVSRNNTGGTQLEPTQGVLQGLGTGQTFLSALQPGDTFSIDIDIFSRLDTIRPHITQMITGNALVMKHGVLMPRNETEDYCSREYPRSMFATNEEGDRFWMMISEKPGMPTRDLCILLKSMGATYAAGADGGGSAQMNLFGKIQNPTTESSPRKLPNSLFVVSTAPDSEDAGQLQFIKPLSTLPAHVSYTPTLRAWTAEGALISQDYRKHTLSCEPASLGTISADGLTFTSNPVTASGKLIATYGSARTETPIEIKNGEVRIILDSVILGNKDYAVEVQAIAGDLALPINPEALTWTSMNLDLCTINEKGVLHAVSDGRTQITGELAPFADTLDVIVEMAHQPQFSISKTPFAKPEVLPFDTTVSFSIIRNAAAVLPLDLRLWGNPDSVLFVVNTDAPVQTLKITYKANNAEASTISKDGLTEANADYTFAFSIRDMFAELNQGIYPIRIESARFAMKEPKKNQPYHLLLKDIILCYSDWSKLTDVENICTSSAAAASCTKLLINGQLYIVKSGHIYNALGTMVK